MMRRLDLIKLRIKLTNFLQMNNKWQPIKTAPKPWQYILGIDKNDDIVICWYGCDEYKPNKKGWWFGEGDYLSQGTFFTPFKPIYWMHLPEPPPKPITKIK